MKHLKTYKIFEHKDNSELIKELEKYGIENYIINNDGTIDVDGDVDLYSEALTKIPFKFGKVTGHFYVSHCDLTSLEGCPKEVGSHFDCSGNKLTNLIGGPQEVGGQYYCGNNRLTSLEGCAGDIGGNLYCGNNRLTSLDCSSVINGDIYCNVGGNFKEEPEFFGICNKIFWK